MRKRWIVLSLIIASMAPGSRVWAKPAPKPASKLSPREEAALEEAIFKLMAGLLQVGAGASESNLNLIETGTSDLARQRAAARREGIPLTPREIQRPSPPPALDAAPIYEQLTRLLKEKPLDEKLEAAAQRLGSRSQYGPEDVAAARKLLADRQDVMTLVHRATDRPQCVFQRDWSPGLYSRSPSIARSALPPGSSAYRAICWPSMIGTRQRLRTRRSLSALPCMLPRTGRCSLIRVPLHVRRSRCGGCKTSSTSPAPTRK
jgi:hypothetical protein